MTAGWKAKASTCARLWPISSPVRPTSERSARRLRGTLAMGVRGQCGGPPAIRPGTHGSDLSKNHLDRGQLAQRIAPVAWHPASSPSCRAEFHVFRPLAVVPAERAIGTSSRLLEKFRQIFYVSGGVMTVLGSQRQEGMRGRKYARQSTSEHVQMAVSVCLVVGAFSGTCCGRKR